jgi:hypothetical protein
MIPDSELIITACDALRGFANAYLDVLADDVSQAEREDLSRAADLIDKALMSSRRLRAEAFFTASSARTAHGDRHDLPLFGPGWSTGRRTAGVWRPAADLRGSRRSIPHTAGGRLWRDVPSALLSATLAEDASGP